MQRVEPRPEGDGQRALQVIWEKNSALSREGTEGTAPEEGLTQQKAQRATQGGRQGDKKEAPV